MTSDQALDLIASLFRVTLFVAGPILLASLFAGIAVGVIQAATQINEASVSFIVKVMAVLAVLVTIGPALASYATGYTRESLQSIERVVH
jgi:flagellar biosynthetic protein FliQ